MILAPVISKLPVEVPVAPLRNDGPLIPHEDTRTRARRRWILRSFLLLLLSAAVLILLVILQRDQATVDTTLRATSLEVRGLQAAVDELNQLPAFWTRQSAIALYYLGDEVRAFARRTDKPVIVAHSGEIPLILRKNGVVVILCERNKLRSEWWSLGEFLGRLRAQQQRIESLEQEIRSQPPVLP